MSILNNKSSYKLNKLFYHMGSAITHCVASLLVSKATASVVRRFQSHFVFVSCSWTPITWAVLMLTASLRS